MKFENQEIKEYPTISFTVTWEGVRYQFHVMTPVGALSNRDIAIIIVTIETSETFSELKEMLSRKGYIFNITMY